jgi:hypothetical protein
MPAISAFGRLIVLAGLLPRCVRSLITATCLVSTVCGCKSLYLHSDAAQQATASAKAELDKVDVASVFDNEVAYSG